MRDRINFLAPLSVQITVHKPAPRDIAALRRGPMTIEVGTDALRRGIRWDFDFLEFGVFERFVQPNGAPLCEAPLGPDETLAVHFTFQSTAGLGLGGRLVSMQREAAVALINAWTTGIPMAHTKFRVGENTVR